MFGNCIECTKACSDFAEVVFLLFASLKTHSKPSELVHRFMHEREQVVLEFMKQNVK